MTQLPAAADSHSICCPHVCPGSASRNHGILGTFRVERILEVNQKNNMWIYDFKPSAQNVCLHVGSPTRGLHQIWRIRFCYSEQNPHRVHLVVGGLDLGQFNQGDAERPDISLGVIRTVLRCFTHHHLRSHPGRKSWKRLKVKGIFQEKKNQNSILCKKGKSSLNNNPHQ